MCTHSKLNSILLNVTTVNYFYDFLQSFSGFSKWNFPSLAFSHSFIIYSYNWLSDCPFITEHNTLILSPLKRFYYQCQLISNFSKTLNKRWFDWLFSVLQNRCYVKCLKIYVKLTWEVSRGSMPESCSTVVLAQESISHHDMLDQNHVHDLNWKDNNFKTKHVYDISSTYWIGNVSFPKILYYCTRE